MLIFESSLHKSKSESLEDFQNKAIKILRKNSKYNGNFLQEF